MAVLKLEIKSVYISLVPRLSVGLGMRLCLHVQLDEFITDSILGKGCSLCTGESLGPSPLIYTKTQLTQQRGSVN